MGETIIDVYHYVKPLGRPLKESIVSVEHMTTEEFTGGVVAAARHAKDFVASTEIFSNGDRIRKERWVEESHVRKLFEMYKPTRHKQPPPKDIPNYDVVIVTDYGHGMMTPELVSKVCNEARYLAVNVQTNSGNFGFNLATKYPRADYLVVDEPEARLATQNRIGRIEDSIETLAKIAPKVVITLGKKGALGWDGSLHYCPAFVDKVVDTIGAGDAFFAITACMAEGPMPLLLRIGNAAGALKAQIVGHREAVTKDALLGLL